MRNCIASIDMLKIRDLFSTLPAHPQFLALFHLCITTAAPRFAPSMFATFPDADASTKVCGVAKYREGLSEVALQADFGKCCIDLLNSPDLPRVEEPRSYQVSNRELWNKKPPIIISKDAAPIISFPMKNPTIGTVNAA